MTGQAVEGALEAEAAMRAARSLASRTRDTGVQTEGGPLTSPGTRLHRRSGVGGLGARASQVTGGEIGEVDGWIDGWIDSLGREGDGWIDGWIDRL